MHIVCLDLVDGVGNGGGYRLAGLPHREVKISLGF